MSLARVAGLWALIKQSAVKWNHDDCLTLGVALAYYTVFSLVAPVLVIVITVAGALFGQEATQGEIVGQIRSLVGNEGATASRSFTARAVKVSDRRPLSSVSSCSCSAPPAPSVSSRRRSIGSGMCRLTRTPGSET